MNLSVEKMQNKNLGIPVGMPLSVNDTERRIPNGKRRDETGTFVLPKDAFRRNAIAPQMGIIHTDEA